MLFDHMLRCAYITVKNPSKRVVENHLGILGGLAFNGTG